MDRDRSTDEPDVDTSSGDEKRVPGSGDDEREARENIQRTGEPDRDDLGNADGAS